MSRDTEVEDLQRRLAPRVLAAIPRRSGGLDAAEDAVQEALIAATRSWRASGMPDNPRGWLLQTASRRLTDRIRAIRPARE